MNAQVDRIEIAEVQRWNNRIVFVDARSLTSVRKNPTRVPGAIQTPINQFEPRLKLLPRGRMLVT
jgi:hypothetical protein